MSSEPCRFQGDIVVQDYYRPEGHAALNFEWGSYDGYLSGGKANGWGVQSIRRRVIPGGLPSDEIAIYRGDWRNGKREGYGRLEIPWESKVYEGGWVDGKASGFGKNLIMQKGWAGEWEESGFKDGYRHGWGVTCVTSDPKETTWYNGGFKEGQRHGYVIKCISGLESYTSIKSGILHGYKTVKRDGIVQSREFFLEGRSHSPPSASVPLSYLPSIVYFNPLGARYQDRTHTVNGIANLANGDSYQGNLSYGTPHGYGLLQVSSAHRAPGSYEGGFKHGFACGYGVWIGIDGFVYAGGWLNGKPYGFGKVTTGGSTYESFWEEGSGWRFETTWQLSPPITIFRVPSPAPMPPAWAL